MEKINAVILKKHIFCEIDIFFNKNNLLNQSLFLSYLANVIHYYEGGSSDSSFITDLNALKEFECDDDFSTNSKEMINRLNNINILLYILDFFIGKEKSRKLIYS